MYTIHKSSQFKTDIKKFKHNKKVLLELRKVVELLSKKEILPVKYNDHGLQGKFQGVRECHLFPDILLVYEYRDKELMLLFLRIGSHSDIFG